MDPVAPASIRLLSKPIGLLGTLARLLFGQRIAAVIGLTWKAAFRFRLFLVIAVLLLASVVGLPLLITKDDGTARGLTQILLTYTLTTITALLGLSTLWLACGTLARDIEECQIQVLATKPIARWQIWLGKWLGILLLNAALLALSGACVYGLLLWRASGLPADQQMILRNEVLIARGSAKVPSLDQEIQDQTDKILRERLSKERVTQADVGEVRRQILENVRAAYQVVPPQTVRTWQIPMGAGRQWREGEQLFLRAKFNANQPSASGTFGGCLWGFGVPRQDRPPLALPPMSMAPDTFTEIQLPANLIDQDGILTVAFLNANQTTLVFPLEDGIEVLYRQGGFGPNFLRGLGIIFCWMALLAALGLAAASFLSFPVAAFFSLGILMLVFSSGTMASAVASGTIMGVNEETGAVGFSILDQVAIPFFRATLSVLSLVGDFSPIDSLSTGRSVTWTQLGLAFAQIVLLLGGLVSLAGIIIFNRRELATAQGTT
jgi:hypothetical protein